jgi:hypothetical protein
MSLLSKNSILFQSMPFLCSSVLHFQNSWLLLYAGHQLILDRWKIVRVKFMAYSFHGFSKIFHFHVCCCQRVLRFAVLSHVFSHVVRVNRQSCQNFWNLYGKTYMFLKNVLLEWKAPFEQLNDFVCGWMFRWIVKFKIDCIENIKDN